MGQNLFVLQYHKHPTFITIDSSNLQYTMGQNNKTISEKQLSQVQIYHLWFLIQQSNLLTVRGSEWEVNVIPPASITVIINTHEHHYVYVNEPHENVNVKKLEQYIVNL